MAAPFAPRKAVHFAIDSDEDQGDLSASTPRLPSTSTSPYSDNDNDNDPHSPLFDLDDDESSTTPRRPTEDNDDDSSYYPPLPLKSNTSSREAAFDLDSDALSSSSLDDDQLSEPLMEGLLQSSGAKRSLDLPGRRGEGKSNAERDSEDGGLLDEMAPEWLTKGAGVFAGIANMSNSILGAGIIGSSSTFPSSSWTRPPPSSAGC